MKKDAAATRIKPLPNDLINQIAAGEVVERPASIVKELIENSLDAGSTRIDILLRGGGIDEVSVVDNGEGISKADLWLTVERHATSKIAKSDDLEAIKTFGFRGEALSSIASVSEIEIKSRQEDEDSGYTLKCDYGEVGKDLIPVGMSVGTVVCVKNLFAKVPARKKFMRATTTEFSHASRVVREVALGNWETNFSVSHQGKQVSSYVAHDPAGRFKEIFSPQWEALSLSEETENFSMFGHLSPTHLIQDRGELYVFVNGRSIRNRTLHAAIRNTYRDTLGSHHDPSGVVFLKIRFDWVDVNVHPQKLEVRCLGQEKLYQWLVASVRKAISQSRSIAVPYEGPSYFTAQESAPLKVLEPTRFYEPITGYQASQPARVTSVPSQQAPLPVFEKPEPLPNLSPHFVYLGQLKASYFLCEDSEGLLLIDHHAIHEKLVFEKLMRESEQKTMPVQQLLLPQVLTFPPHDLEILTSHVENFLKAGFEIEILDGNEIAVKSRPAILEEKKVQQVIAACLEQLEEKALPISDIVKESLRPLFATVACHSVVRANQMISRTETLSLLDGLSELSMGWTCPHGRPVLYRVPFLWIEKQFERR